MDPKLIAALIELIKVILLCSSNTPDDKKKVS